MAANTQPIFPLTPKVSFLTLTTQNTNMDGTGTAAVLFTAGTNGARVDEIKCKALGTNVASVLRIFINNGSDAETATNNALFTEISLPATTADADAALTEEVVLTGDGALKNLTLPNGYKLLATVGTTVASGWKVTCLGGDY